MPQADKITHKTALQKGRRPKIPLENPKLGERIKFAREKMGLSQAQVALTLGVTRNAIAQWETDRCAPATGRLPTLAGRLGVTLDWLLEKLPQTGSDAVGSKMAADLRLLEEARQFGVDLEIVVAETRERRWVYENRASLGEANACMARNGVWSPDKRRSDAT